MGTRDSRWLIILILPLVAFPILSILIPYTMVIPRSYGFLPYDLKIRPGTNGDGGLSAPPGIVPTDPPNPILNYPRNLTAPGELGWSGDLIVDFDRSAWTVVAVVENTSPPIPAIIAADYSQGHIVYVTHQLARDGGEELVYNILVWYLSDRNKPIKVAVMIDSTEVPEQILNDWERCFSRVIQIGNETKVPLDVQEKRISQYELNGQDLSRFNVLVLAVGWGDGYYSPSWNWDSHKRDSAILDFVKEGGLLLLPEAGLFDDYGIALPDSSVFPPTRGLQGLLSSQANAFSMAVLSLSAIGVLSTRKEEVRRYNWIAGYLFLATILWVIVPLAGGQLLRQTALVLAALGWNGTAILIILLQVGGTTVGAVSRFLNEHNITV